MRKHTNISKPFLIHVAGFNLSLILSHRLGFKKATGLQDAAATLMRALAECSALGLSVEWRALSREWDRRRQVRTCAAPNALPARWAA